MMHSTKKSSLFLEFSMFDLIVMAGGLGLFVLMIGYASVCDRL